MRRFLLKNEDLNLLSSTEEKRQVWYILKRPRGENFCLMASLAHWVISVPERPCLKINK